MEIDSSLPFDPPGKKKREGTKRRRRAQRLFLGKTMGGMDLPGSGDKESLFSPCIPALNI
jgi:hypothetical protein